MSDCSQILLLQLFVGIGIGTALTGIGSLILEGVLRRRATRQEKEDEWASEVAALEAKLGEAALDIHLQDGEIVQLEAKLEVMGRERDAYKELAAVYRISADIMAPMYSIHGGQPMPELVKRLAEAEALLTAAQQEGR